MIQSVRKAKVMSLLKRNKDKQIAAEKKLAARHTLVKMGVDRSVRDAYFQGVVFAAVANDDKIDESERARLIELGEALEISPDDVAETLLTLQEADDDTKNAVIEECARQLTSFEVAECFLREFEELWTLGGGDKDEFVEYKPKLLSLMGGDVGARIRAKELSEKKARENAAAEESLRRKELAARQEVAAKQLVASFYQSSIDVIEANGGVEGTINLEILESARTVLLAKGYGNVPIRELVKAVHCSYLGEFRGKDVVGRDNAFSSALGFFDKSIVSPIVEICEPFTAGCKAIAKTLSERKIRRRAVWALASLYAVKKDMDVGVVAFFNELMRKVESVPISADSSNGSQFWDNEIARYDVMRWFSESE